MKVQVTTFGGIKKQDGLLILKNLIGTTLNQNQTNDTKADTQKANSPLQYGY